MVITDIIYNKILEIRPLYMQNYSKDDIDTINGSIYPC